MTQVCCPGCGLTLDSETTWVDTERNASFACILHAGSLNDFALTHGGIDFLQQHVVDAYAAQHAGGEMKPITIAFSLAGLYLRLQRGYTGRQVQIAHAGLALQSKSWQMFTRPAGFARMTVDDVVQAADKRAAIMRWCWAVWEWWEPQHTAVQSLVDRYAIE